MQNEEVSSEDETYRPRKRAAQACNNCRRKKSKCPGEMPQCSLCARLNQRCVYSSKRRKTRHLALEEGLTQPPTTMDRVEQTTAATEGSSRHTRPVSTVPESSFPLPGQYDFHIARSLRLPTPPTRALRSPATEFLPKDIAVEAINCYFRYFDCLPYPLLSSLAKRGVPSPDDLPPVLLHAIVALSLPVCRRPFSTEAGSLRKIHDFCSKSVWELLCQDYANFEFDEAYFQGLCLLAQVDFATGRTDRAQSQIHLGLKLAQIHGMLDSRAPSDLNTAVSITRSDIVWTLFMMDRIIGTDSRSIPQPMSSFHLPLYEAGPERPVFQAITVRSSVTTNSLTGASSLPSISVIAVIAELLDIWSGIITHIFQTPGLETVPFWRNESARAKIQTRLLDFELKINLHTYTSTGTPTRVIEEPQHRKYYAARCFLHMLHVGALFCINHPFIIFTSTQHLGGNVPWSFLQNSYKISSINSDWVILLINDMEKSNITLHDPFIGYLVAIAATIHLDKSLNKTSNGAERAKQKFEKCYKFVGKMADQWPSMSNALNVLNTLQIRLRNRQTMTYVEDEYDGMVHPNGIREVSLPEDDVRLMWTLFDYAAVSSQQRPALNHSEIQMNHTGNGLPPRTLSNEYLPSQTLTHPVESVDIQRHTETPSISWEELSELRNLQEDEDDWLLFGKPWTAYFPSQIETWQT